MSLPRTLFCLISAGEYSEPLLFSFTLTRDRAKYLLAKMDMAKGLDAVDREFDSLSFWPSVSPFAWESWVGEEEAEEEGDIHGDWFESEHVRGITEARTEIDRLHVYPSAVYWSALRKHTDLTYETFYIGRDYLENLLTTLAEDLAAETETA